MEKKLFTLLMEFVSVSILWNTFMNWVLHQPYHPFVLSLNICKTSTSKECIHLREINTHRVTQSVSWSEEVRTIRGILAVSGFFPVPWNPHSAGLLFVAGSGFSEWHSSHCTGHRDRGGRPEKILGGGKQWLKAAHKCLLWLFASPPSRALSDQPLSLTA